VGNKNLEDKERNLFHPENAKSVAKESASDASWKLIYGLPLNIQISLKFEANSD